MKIATIILLFASPIPAADMHVQRDLAYAEPKNERQTLDVYSPTEGKNHPVIFWIHGGGWQRGDKADVQTKPQAFVEKGFVFVSTNYRFVPNVTIKQMAGDVARAIRWVHDHAKEYGGDSSTIFVMGHSAGAQLAALVCTDDGYLKAEGLSLSIIKGCVPVDGDTYDVMMQIATVEERRAAIYRQKFGDEKSQTDLSPVTHLARGKNIPPFLILHVADHPETKGQSERLAKALEQIGVPAKAFPAAGKDHTTINSNLGLTGDEPTKVLVDFLDGVLKKRLAAAGESIRIGVAESDITPPNGFPMAGYYHERLAIGTHDPLKAKAIVFLGPHEQAALVVCDLTGIAVDLTAEVRRRASAKTGIPPANIVVAGTHSHTAPDYGKELYAYLASPPRDGSRSSDDSSQQTYVAKLVGATVEAIERAHAVARPVSVEAGAAVQETPVSFCRRFVMRDGSVRTWMSLDHPEVVRPAAPIDPEIGLVAVRAADSDKPTCILSNFALHLDTVGGQEWAADYPFYIEQSLRRSLGGEVVSIFGTGCCGDINHVDPTRRERNKTDFIGTSLAASVDRGLGQLRRLERPELRVRSSVVHVPLQEATAEQVAESVKILTRFKEGEKIEFYDHVTAYKRIMLDQLRHRRPYTSADDHLSWGLSHTWAGVGDTLPVEVSVICLGDELAIVCLPGEVFVELGLAIKRASPFRTTLIVELSNCVETLYIPTRAAYAGGSYEVTNSALQPGSGEMLVEAAIRLLRDAASSRSQAQ